MALALEGVRVLAIEQFGAGPFATLQLADLGAEVVKIEDPAGGGDIGRYVPPFQEGEDSLYFESLNRNKASISLDLRAPAGRAVFEDLVREADVLFSNLRGDQPERLRIKHEHLAHINPKIVCCTLTGFGTTGPRAKEGGYDYIMQALTGWMSLTGEPDGPPTKSGLSLVDLAGGYVAAFSMVAGLRRAERDGVGCDCDISLFETALALLTYIGTWAATEDHVPARTTMSAHPSLVPFQAFQGSDGWFTVACPKEKFWVALCHAIERPELLEDERFKGFGRRDANRVALVALLQERFLTRTVDVWVELLLAHGIPCAPVNTVLEGLRDPQVAFRESIVETEHPRFGTVRSIATPLRVGPEPKPVSRAPRRGEHTPAILGRLGYSPERVAELLASGALGPVASGAGT